MAKQTIVGFLHIFRMFILLPLGLSRGLEWVWINRGNDTHTVGQRQ